MAARSKGHVHRGDRGYGDDRPWAWSQRDPLCPRDRMRGVEDQPPAPPSSGIVSRIGRIVLLNDPIISGSRVGRVSYDAGVWFRAPQFPDRHRASWSRPWWLWRCRNGSTPRGAGGTASDSRPRELWLPPAIVSAGHVDRVVCDGLPTTVHGDGSMTGALTLLCCASLDHLLRWPAPSGEVSTDRFQPEASAGGLRAARAGRPASPRSGGGFIK